MKSTDLRVGNWVQCDIWDNGNITFLKVKVVTEDSIFCKDHSGSFGGFEGIVINSEILEKAGFVNCESIEVFFELTGFKFVDGKVLATHFKRDRAVALLYVHQLQNLYFALTGSELGIKL